MRVSAAPTLVTSTAKRQALSPRILAMLRLNEEAEQSPRLDVSVPRDREAVDPRVALLAAGLSSKAVRRRKAFIFGALATCAAVAAILIVCRLLMSSEKWLELLMKPWSLLVLILFATSAPIAGLVADLRGKRRTRDDVSTVAVHDDVRLLPSLIDVLSLDDCRSHDAAAPALIRLLPQLRASDRELLSPAQYARLNGILAKPVESPLYKDFFYLFRNAPSSAVDLRVSILKAYEQVGDPRSLRTVRDLAKKKGKTTGEKRVAEAAAECLPFLESIAGKKRSSQVLLRSSSEFESLNGELLRPAGNGNNEETRTLLRAAEVD